MYNNYFECKQCGWEGLITEKNIKCKKCKDTRYLIEKYNKNKASNNTKKEIIL